MTERCASDPLPYTARMSRLETLIDKLSPDDRLDFRVLVVFCLGSTLVLTPIAINFFRAGSLGAAYAIGGLAFGYALLGLWIVRVRKASPYNLWLAAVATLATLLPVPLLGEPADSWIYPLILVNYYLLTRRAGLFVNLFSCLVILALLTREPGWAAASHQAAVLAAVMFFAHVFVWAIDRRQDELRRQSRHDPLTGLANRRALDTAMPRAAARCQRSGLPLSIIMVDLDKFKNVNDRYGHSRGDSAICTAALVISGRLREGDRVFRYGGEEFVILCEDTDHDGVRELAERLRAGAERELLVGDLSITMSAGIATLLEDESVRDCFDRADQALLAAKGGGRNRVHSMRLSGRSAGAPDSR